MQDTVQSCAGFFLVGHKTTLAFKILNGKNETNTDWLMHEYRLPSRKDKKFDDLALCKINRSQNPKKCQEEIDEEERRAKGKQAEVSERQCLMGDSSGKWPYVVSTGSSQYPSSSSSHFMPQEPFNNFKISHFLGEIVRTVENLDERVMRGVHISSKKRKAVDEDDDNNENSERKETEMVVCHRSSTGRRQGSRRPHGSGSTVGDSGHHDTFEDDPGASTLGSNHNKAYDLKFSEEGTLVGNSSSPAGGVARNTNLNVPLDDHGEASTSTVTAASSLATTVIHEQQHEG